MNKEKKEFNLIEGIFSAVEAKEILTTLINDKIKFHDYKIFSQEERFGKANAETLARKAQLLEIKERLIEYLDQYHNSDQKLRIHSNIHIITN